jgi:hypothetical protein
MTTQAVTALRVADEAFLVTSTIERCPKIMMIRELLMNALEAAQLAPEGNRRVEVSAQPEDGVHPVISVVRGYVTQRLLDDRESEVVIGAWSGTTVLSLDWRKSLKYGVARIPMTGSTN